MALTKEAILQADDLPNEEVPTPEWGEGTSVIVKTLTATEMDSFQGTLLVAPDTAPNARALMAVRAIVDTDGERIFSDGEAVALGAKSSLTVGRIFDVAVRLSGMTQEANEELAKNSPADPSGDSPSA